MALLLLAFAIIHGLWTLSHWGGETVAAKIAGLPLVVSSTGAMLVVLWRAYTEPQGSFRRGWTILGVALGLYSVANAIWGYHTVVYARIPFPTVADALFLMFPWLVFAALTQLTDSQLGPVAKTRIRLNTLSVVCSLGLIEWAWLLRGAVGQADSLLAAVTAVLYPIGDLMMLGGVAFTLQRAWSSRRRAVLLPLLGGVLLFVLGDVIYAVQIAGGTYHAGTLLDVCWTLGQAAFALAATRQIPLTGIPDGPQARGEDISAKLILGFKLGAYVSLLPLMIQSSTRLLDAVIAVVVLLVLGVLTFLSQRLDLQENLALTHELQASNAQLKQRVQEAVSTVETRNTELTAQNKEIQTFSELADLLQASLTLDEVKVVLLKAVRRLFPGTQGSVGMINPSRNQIETFVSWGDETSLLSGRAFAPQDCWALRRGRPHLMDGEDTQLSMDCAQVQEGSGGTYLCLPLVAQGETVGVLRLTAPPGVAQDTDTLQTTAQNMARQVALALANLRLRDTLRAQSSRDPLTGLYNRRFLEETLERELHRAERTHVPMSVLMLDVDHFKRFNDAFGHDAGDFVLQELARVMRQTFREQDVVCRYGGEEFTVVLLDTGEADAVTRAEALRGAAQALTLSFQGKTLGPVTISVGVATLRDSRERPEELIRQADQALYQAKRNGRNRVHLASDASVSPAGPLEH